MAIAGQCLVVILFLGAGLLVMGIITTIAVSSMPTPDDHEDFFDPMKNVGIACTVLGGEVCSLVLVSIFLTKYRSQIHVSAYMIICGIIYS